MEVKSITETLLETGQEYSFQTIFEKYDELGQKDCEKENELIDKKNDRIFNEIKERNLIKEREARKENSKRKAEADETNKQKEANKWAVVSIVAVFLGLIVTVLTNVIGILTLPIFFTILATIITPLKVIPKYVKPETEEFHQIPHRNYTFIPMGKSECVICEEKIELESRVDDRKCPNCHGERVVISELSPTVQVKDI